MFDHMENIQNKDQLSEFIRLLDYLLAGTILELDPERILSQLIVNEYVRKRAEHVPPEYIFGEAAFKGRKFMVNGHTLIPTPETSLLVDVATAQLAAIKGTVERPMVVDVGTGCGNIGISISLDNPYAKVYAIDISKEATQLAKRNAEMHGVSDKVTVVDGDLLEPIEKLGLAGNIDLIVCNPPYIPTSSIDRLNPEIKDHEPILALDGGTFGIDILSRLVSESFGNLKPGGRLVFEFGEGQESLVSRLFRKNGKYCDMEFFSYNGKSRVFLARKPSDG